MSKKLELFKDQKYNKLRKHHQDLGVPWTDPTFPPSDTSIGHSTTSTLPRNVQWKRPQEICDNPKLFVDGISSRDSNQGKLGNCWFVAACSVLSGSKVTWEKVIPGHSDQEWDENETDKYSGIFRFRFWRFGRWVEVLVDDLLPVDENNMLLFAHSSTKTEFWISLLEKAYAKFHGCYASLAGGNLSDALVDFTSGVSEVIDLEKEKAVLRSDDVQRKTLFQTMMAEIEDHALMCCAIKANSTEEMEQRTDLGLVKGHAYGITAVKKVPTRSTGLMTFFKGREKLWLVRLQNPWGKVEWKGPMSDTSPEWNKIPEKEREKLGLTFRDDGEFWMPFDDFLANFTEMSICRLINTSLFSFAKTWQESQFFDSWTIGAVKLDRAGGCANFPETFLNNPQFRFDVVKGDDPKVPSQRVEIIIQLSQRDKRVLLEDPKEHQIIGFQVLRVEGNRIYRLHSVLPDSVVATSDYIKSKHIFLRFFPKVVGRYLIVPTTFKAGDTTDFLLRIFTENSSVKNITPVVKDCPEHTFWKKMCCIKKPMAVTRIKVNGATDIEKQGTFGSIDLYCIINCEGKKLKGPVDENTQEPQWKDFNGVFYRKNLNKPIILEIWDKSLVVDSFVGRAEVKAPIGPKENIVKEELELQSKGKEPIKLPGKISVEYQTTDDLMQF